MTSSAIHAEEKTSVKMSPLYQMVGQDVGVCIELDRLNQRIPQAAQSTFYQRLQKTSFYQSWMAGNDYQKFQEGLKEIEKQTGQSAEELAMQLFGQSVLLAIYPSNEGEPKGLLLTNTSNAKTLQKTIEVWNKADQSQIEKRTYAGAVYYKKVNDPNKKRKKEVVFYFQKKELFALSDHEDAIRKVIDFSNGKHPESIYDSVDFQQMHASLAKESVLRLFINPRAWDNEIKADEHSKKGEKAIVNLWRKCRSVSVGVQLQDGLVVEAFVLWNRNAISERWQQFAKATSGTSSLLKRIPASAVVVACGQFDGTVLKQLFHAITSQQDRDNIKPQYLIAQSLLLELDPFDDLLANLGTNWGAWIQPAKQKQESSFLLEALFVTDLNNPFSTSKRKKEIPDALGNLTITGLNALAVVYNSQQKETSENNSRAVLRRKKVENTVIRWVGSSSSTQLIDSVTSCQLAVGLSPEWLLISNSPRLIKEFITPLKETEKLLIDSERFKKWSEKYFAKNSELLYVNVAALRLMMKNHQTYFTKQFTKKGNTAPLLHAKNHHVNKRLARLQEVLAPMDVIFVAVRYLDNGIHIKAGAVAE